MAKTIVAVASDLHCNSTTGLCPASGVMLDDGGRYMPSKAQKWLWRCWADFWDKVRGHREKGDEVIVVLNGDLVDGYHHGTTQLIAPEHQETQDRIALDALRPALDLMPDALFVVRGTETHVGKSGQHEEWIARQLGAVRDEAAGTASWWHLLLDAAGVTIDFAHHGRRGYRPWTHGSAVNLLAEQISAELLRAKHYDPSIVVPDLAVRSHVHVYRDSGPVNAVVRTVTTPAWQLSTAYVHRIAPGSHANVGGVVVLCEDGDYQIKGYTYRLKRRKPWKR